MDAPDPCPRADLAEHRLETRAPIVDLLGSAPGSVPFFTHLEVGNAVSRIEGGSDAATQPEKNAAGETPDYGALAARHQATPPSEKPTAPIELRTRVTMLYVQRRERWPLGGLIDLVV